LFAILPECIRYFKQLKSLWLCDLKLTSLPDWLGELEHLEKLDLDDNLLTDLPSSLGKLKSLTWFNFLRNPFNPKLAKACKQGLNAVAGCKPDLAPLKAYLRAKAAEQTGSSQ
jgi:Leucine-rich repeat (LRR) protein